MLDYKENMGEIKAGDIIRLYGKEEYVFLIDAEHGTLGTNACNESWIERGLRNYGEECYPLTRDEYDEAEVVGHYGDGYYFDGRAWYEERH